MTQQRSEALTSGQLGPKLQGVGLAPTSMILGSLAAGQIAKKSANVNTFALRAV